MTIFIHRQQVNFFGELVFTNRNLEQQMKLVRNQFASIDLGNPNFKLHIYKDVPAHKMTGRDKYMEWVLDWKSTYLKLSECIRALKNQRGFQGTSALEEQLKKFNSSWSNLNPGDLHTYNHARVAKALEELKRCAQIMLNARYVGKLASAEAKRRAKQSAPVAEVV